MQIQQQYQVQKQEMRSLTFVGGLGPAEMGKTAIIHKANDGNQNILHTYGIPENENMYRQIKVFNGIIDGDYIMHNHNGVYRRTLSQQFIQRLASDRTELQFALLKPNLEEIAGLRGDELKKYQEINDMNHDVFMTFLRETNKRGLIVEGNNMRENVKNLGAFFERGEYVKY